MLVALWDRDRLAADTGLADDGYGFDGVVLAYLVRSESEVDAVLAEAKGAGARITGPLADDGTVWLA
jgi:hypothetical protein